MLTRNVQSLSPKIGEIIELIQVEIFDVITPMRPGKTPKTSICVQKLPYMVQRFFLCTKQLQQEGEWINHVCEKHIEPNRKKVVSHLYNRNYSNLYQSQECNAPEICILIYKNTIITSADDEFSTILEEILLSRHECVIMGDFNLPNIDWALQGPTPAPGNKLMQLLADNNLTQHVHETTRQNNILEQVIYMEEELILNRKRKDKIRGHQNIQFQ